MLSLAERSRDEPKTDPLTPGGLLLGILGGGVSPCSPTDPSQNKKCNFPHPFLDQAPVVQTLDSAIHRINHYPADKYYGNQLRYPLDSDLSGG